MNLQKKKEKESVWVTVPSTAAWARECKWWDGTYGSLSN